MPINWVDVADPRNPPDGAPKLSAANMARLALIEDIGAAGTPTGDAVKAAVDARGTVLLPALAGGGADNSSAIQASIDAASAAGGGTVYLGPGTWRAKALQIKSNVTLSGAGIGATTLKLVDGANTDLVTVPSFGTLTGGGTQGGPTRWAVRHITLDGNAVNQTSGWVLRVYAADYRIDNVVIQYGKSGGVWSEWGTGGTNMESRWSNFRLSNSSNVDLDFNGPHDSQFVNGVINQDGSGPDAATVTYGIRTRGNAAGEIFTNVHVWGGYTACAWYLEGLAYCVNCYAEGAKTGQVMLGVGGSKWIGGTIFGTNGAASLTEKGLLIGDATHTGVSSCVVHTDIHNISTGGFLVDLTGSIGGNQICGTIATGSRTDSTALNGATVSYSTGSTTITDSKVKAGDTGKTVTGTGVPANATVGNVGVAGAGTFNFMVSGTATLPTAASDAAGLTFLGGNIFATVPRNDEMLMLTCKDNPSQNWLSWSNSTASGFNFSSGNGGVRLWAPVQIATSISNALRLTTAAGVDTMRVNTSAQRIEIPSGTRLRGFSDTSYTTQTYDLNATLGTIATAKGTTASRPSPGTAGQGAQWFDTTLNKPVWSDGTGWRDATGTLV